MAEHAECAALRAAVTDGSLLAVLTAVGDLLGEKPWPDDYEGLHFQYLVNLFDGLAFVVGELAADYDVPETANEVEEFGVPLGHTIDVLDHINIIVQKRASDDEATDNMRTSATACDMCYKKVFNATWEAKKGKRGGIMRALMKLQDTWAPEDQQPRWRTLYESIASAVDDAIVHIRYLKDTIIFPAAAAAPAPAPTPPASPPPPADSDASDAGS